MSREGCFGLCIALLVSRGCRTSCRVLQLLISPIIDYIREHTETPDVRVLYLRFCKILSLIIAGSSEALQNYQCFVPRVPHSSFHDSIPPKKHKSLP